MGAHLAARGSGVAACTSAIDDVFGEAEAARRGPAGAAGGAERAPSEQLAGAGCLESRGAYRGFLRLPFIETTLFVRPRPDPLFFPP
jgi:hypothetical protein